MCWVLLAHNVLFPLLILFISYFLLFFGVSDFLNASLNSRPHVAYSRCVYCRQHGELRALSPWAGLVGRGWRYSLTLTLPWRRFSAPAWRQTWQNHWFRLAWCLEWLSECHPQSCPLEVCYLRTDRTQISIPLYCRRSGRLKSFYLFTACLNSNATYDPLPHGS